MTDDASPSRSDRVRWALWWLPSIAILVILVWAVWQRWDEVREVGALPVGALVLATLLHVGGNLLLVQAWRVQLRAAGSPTRFGQSVAIWSTSQLARFLFPGANFGARALLARRMDVGAGIAAVTTVVELALMLLVHPLVVLAVLPWWSGFPDDLAWVGAASLVPTAVLVGLIAAPGRAVRLVADVLRVLPVVGRRVPDRERLRQVDVSRRAMADLVGIHLVNVVVRIVSFIVLLAATIPLDGPTLAAGIGAAALGRLVGLVAFFAPAGIGPREGATVLLLTPVTGAAPAIVAVAATRLSEILAEAVVWGVSRRSAPRVPAPD